MKEIAFFFGLREFTVLGSYSVKTIVVCSQKGGVGKTTLAINLVHALSRAGRNALLVDSDPQGSVGLSLTQQSRHFLGFFDYLDDPAMSLDQILVATREETMSLVISGKSGSYKERETLRSNSKARLRELLAEAREEQFDYVIIDTQAGITGLTEDFLHICDGVIVPQQAEPLGVRSIPKLLQVLARIRSSNPQLQVLGIILTMVKENLTESVDAADSLRRLLPPSLVFNQEIERDDLFIRASARGVPVSIMTQAEDITRVFDNLRREFEEKLRLEEQEAL